MVNRKFSPEIYGQIDYFLDIGWSQSVIQKHMKANGVNISLGHISKIKNRKENNSENSPPVQRPGPKRFLDNRQTARLKQMASKKDPPVLKDMANTLNTTVRVIQSAIRDVLGGKLGGKPKGHFLTEPKKEKRRARAWALYRLLKCDQWKKIITSNEAWFYMTSQSGKRSVQYIFGNQTRKNCEVRTHQSHQKGVMVWAAISARGTFGPIFVELGAKIDQIYYTGWPRIMYRKVIVHSF